MKLNLTELSSSLTELRKAQKEQNYTNLIAQVFMTLMRKKMDYSALSFCRSEQDVKSVYSLMRQEAIKQVKQYLSELKKHPVPTSQQDRLFGQVVIGNRQLQRLAQKRKLCPFFAVKSRHRINKQLRKISEQEFDANIWINYLENQCREYKPQSSFIAELSKFADKC